MNLVSIIIPIYNSEKYLIECLDSVLEQTYSDFELILIDDGSTDISLQICRKYEERDSRIKVLTQKNAGQASARNLGIENADGDYIAFIDSDDAISPDVFQNAIDAFTNDKDLDVVQFPLYLNYGTEKAFLNNKKSQKISGNTNLWKQWIEKDNISWIVCNKIFKKQVFENLRFPKMIYEDNFINAEILDTIQNLKIIDKGIYYYYTRIGSTTNTNNSEKKEKDTQKVNFKIYESVKNNKDLSIAKTIIQEKILNVGISLHKNYNHKDVILFSTNEISFANVLQSPIPMKQKVKLLLYKFVGKNIFKLY